MRFTLVLAVCAAVYWPFALGRLLGAGEAASLHIPYGQLLLEHLRELDLPLWNRSVGLGEPFGANPQTMAFYPLRWLSLLSGDPVRAVSWLHLMHVLLAAAGAWLSARRLGMRPPSASVAAIVYAASPLFTHAAVRPNEVGAIAWSPWIVLAAIALSKRHCAGRVGALAAVLASSALCGSPAILLSQLVLALVVAGRRGVARSAEAMFSVAWAIGLTGLVALPFFEYVGHAVVRPSALAPMAIRSLWLLGDKGAVFFGTTAAVLIAFALASRMRRLWRFAALAFLFVAGSSAWPDLLLAAALPLSLLAGWGVAPLVRWIRRRSRWFVALAVIAALSSALLAAATSPDDVLSFIAPTAIAACALFVFSRFGPSAAMLIVIGELGIAHATLGMPEWTDAAPLYQKQTLVDAANLLPAERVAINPAINEGPIVGVTSRQRLLPLRFVEDGLAGVALHPGMVPARFADVMEVTDVVMLEMFAARYAIGYWDAPAREDVVELTPWPRAWLVTHTERVDDDEARRTFFAQPRQTERIAFAEGLPAMSEDRPDDCVAEVKSISHEELVVKTRCSLPSVLVTSDLWYPGWRVNGRAMHRTNYLMRGVPLEAGAHEVTFCYEPGSFRVGAIVSLIALAALIAAVVRRRRAG